MRNSVFHTAILSLAVLFSAQLAAEKQASDHPLLSRYPGATLEEVVREDFGEQAFLVHDANAENKIGSRVVEGEIGRYFYKLKKDTSTLAIIRSLENSLKSAGFSATAPVDEAQVESVESKMRPLFQIENHYPILFTGFRHLYMTRNSAAGKQHVEIFAEKIDSEHHIFYYIAEEKPQELTQLTVSSAEMSNALTQNGHVALYGIHFDTGSATVKPESADELANIAKALKQNGSLKLHIVGHTDNTGALEANLKLSQQRAQAVLQALTKDYGIAASRLSAHGVGPLTPIASNAAETGRAQNRRVELVQQ
jgi:outer membrane protein OmpA-like peptidoglycan-associated protein